MIDNRHEHGTEQDLKRLFDATSRTAGDDTLDRMLSRAMEIPSHRPSWWRRIVDQAPRGGWIAVPLAAVAALLLVLGVDSMVDPGHPAATPVAMLKTVAGAGGGAASAGTTNTPDAASGADLVPADPLAALDSDFNPLEDDSALLDPPHMAFDNVGDSVWLAVYQEVLENRISL